MLSEGEERWKIKYQLTNIKSFAAKHVFRVLSKQRNLSEL